MHLVLLRMSIFLFIKNVCRNLLLDEKNPLLNRTMHISGILVEKVDIESVKVDIQNKMLSFSNKISGKTINHAIEIYLCYGKEQIFGRSMV